MVNFLWDTSGTETLSASPIPDSGAALSDTLSVRNTTLVEFFLDYTQGTETSIIIQISFSPTGDNPEKFYNYSSVDVASGAIEVFPHSISFSGTYRLVIPVNINSDKLMVSLYRSDGDGVGSSIDIIYRTSNPQSYLGC